VNADPLVTVLIPARAGSVRLPGKNRALVGSLSLVDRSIAHGRALGAHQILVTSDDPAIRQSLAMRSGVTVLDRPPHLATASAKTDDVISHVVEAGHVPENALMVILQPTSPFRNRSFLRVCLQSAANWPDHATISVTPAAKNPAWLRDMVAGGELLDVTFGGEPVVPNGSVYAFTVNAMVASGSLSKMKKVAVLSDPTHSCDIDDEFELVCARSLVLAGFGDDIVDLPPAGSADHEA